MLFAAGDESGDFFVIESGVVAIVQGLGQENRVIAIHGAHRFLGELSLVIGHRLYLSAVVRDPGEVIQIPVEKLREIIDEDKALSDVILGAFIARRSILFDAGARDQAHRLAVLTRLPPAARDPGAEPDALPVDRSRG